MLRNQFSVADPLVKEFLDHRIDPNGTSWFENCWEQGWTVEQMMSQFEAWKEDRVTIDHEPVSPRPEPERPSGRMSLDDRAALYAAQGGVRAFRR